MPTSRGKFQPIIKRFFTKIRHSKLKFPKLPLRSNSHVSPLPSSYLSYPFFPIFLLFLIFIILLWIYRHFTKIYKTLHFHSIQFSSFEYQFQANSIVMEEVCRDIQSDISSLRNNTYILPWIKREEIVGTIHSLFGKSMSMNHDGSIIAIGSPRYESCGCVTVYSYQDHNYNQLGKIMKGIKHGNDCGNSIALNSIGNILAIGEKCSNNKTGLVRVFQYNDNNDWVQLGTNIIGENYNDRLGCSVALDTEGTILALGAWGMNDQCGCTFLYSYHKDRKEWIQKGETIKGSKGERCGWSVSLSNNGNIVAIGSPYQKGSRGCVRIYHYKNQKWNIMGKSIIGEKYSKCGACVSLAGDGYTVAVGCVGISATRSTGSSHSKDAQLTILTSKDGSQDTPYVSVFVYTIDTHKWKLLGEKLDTMTINNPNSDNITTSIYPTNTSGRDIALSSDGRTIAIGCQRISNDTPVQGYVRILSYVLGTWRNVTSPIEQEKNQDKTGYAVSFSQDGRVVAVGSPMFGKGKEGSGKDGKVRIWEMQ